MRLGYLLNALPGVLERVGGDVEISGIAADSRQVRPGNAFVAIPGLSVDGHRFIAEAVGKGAAAVIGERPLQELPDTSEGKISPQGAFTYVRVPDAREAWGWLCAAWHGFPSRKMTVIGVTGTDGKTTTVNLIHAILRAAGFNTGMINTVNARIGEEEEDDTGLHTTTPDPPQFQGYLARMVEAGVTHAVVEVTSHGLAQHRVDGCDFDVAVVTNITHEHLNFHRTLEAYQQAKSRLFKELTRSFRKPGTPKVTVLNRDDSSYAYLHPFPADRQVVYSMNSKADVSAHSAQYDPDATHFTLHLPGGQVDAETTLVGAHNVSNALAAAAVGEALGLPPEIIAKGIAAVKGVPGRMERIEAGQDFLAIVDFAHTPNALKQALMTSGHMARLTAGESSRVIVVFGCAGLRDRKKRATMGRIAGNLADVVIITAEDPRTEDLKEIMAENAAAATSVGKREGVDLWRVPDRGRAILKACHMARPGDVVIACGKGHEQSMCFGTTEYPWDDRVAMRKALQGKTLNTLPTARHRNGASRR